jgi:ATP-dependent DNA helicase RecG
LKKLVAAGESDRLELKKSTGQRTEAARTVCAMLNGMGGFVVIGASDRGELLGQQISASTLQDIAAELGRIEPPAFPDVETIALKGDRAAIILRVPGGGGPYIYDGRAYLRLGPTTRMMPQRQYERMLLERMHAAQRWENQPALGMAVRDLNRSEITRTVEEAIRRQRLEDPGTRRVENLLAGFGLMEKGRILNAAVVLFGKPDRLLPKYPQCALRMARFRGVDKSEFLDNRQETGDAFDLFQRAQRFFRDHLPVAGRVLPNVFERVDDPLYPPAALREAVANALCHRDYSIAGGAVSIAIYDDRLEIGSTGVLPFDLTPEDLAQPHQSRPWNPLIAQTFYRRGLIEAWGRGTLKMRELTQAAGLPPPEIECHAGDVLVRFRPGASAEPKARLPKGGKKVESGVESRVESGVESARGRILQLLAENPLSKFQIALGLGKKAVSGQVHDRVKTMHEAGLIEYTIPEKPNSRLQQYRLTTKGRALLKWKR